MAVVVVTNTMAQSNTKDDVKPTIFHDFLGVPVAKCAGGSDGACGGGGGSPSASASGGGGGGAAPISSTSDLASGSKRSHSDSVFIGASREIAPQIRPDYADSPHFIKMLRSVGAEHSRWPHEDRVRLTSAAIMVEPAVGVKTDANASKWERAIPVNVGPMVQYPPRYGYQALSNQFKDANMGASVISQTAADEGSRTGIKGSGILSSVNVTSAVAEPSLGKQKSAVSVPEPGSSNPLRRQGSTTASRQMTIFYGGQAHVFDDVHPNKADVIMALAGSNGGSWSTNYSPNSAVKPTGGEIIPVSGESDNFAMRGRLNVSGNSSHGLGSNDRMSMLPGAQGSVLMKDARAE